MARILVVEDDEAMREFLAQALTRSGHEVHASPDGETAQKELHRQPFDVLMSDIEMPGMDGVELARRAIENHPHIKVMFVTGYAATAMQATDILAKDAKVLAKPFYLSELMKQVARILDFRPSKASGKLKHAVLN